MKVLKARNLMWLVAALILDVLIILVLVFNSAVDEMPSAKAVLVRFGLATLLPIPLLLLSSLITSNLKAVLIFWRWKFPLPGARAFSVHAPADPRIDLDKLRRNVGAFPVGERDQNSKWYGLYRLVDTDEAVADSHKNYLLFRDIAALSLLLTAVVPFGMYISEMPGVGAVAAIFSLQYLLAAISARTSGVRLVQNVLAVHASRKVTGSKPAPRKPAVDVEAVR